MREKLDIFSLTAKGPSGNLLPFKGSRVEQIILQFNLLKLELRLKQNYSSILVVRRKSLLESCT